MKLKIAVLVTAAVLMLSNAVCYADGSAPTSAEVSVTAGKYLLADSSTGTVLAENGSTEQFPASHFAKLMTLLLVCEKIESGEISAEEKVTVGDYASSRPSPVIWLEKGESISLTELIKAVTVGNANDACTALFQTAEPDEEKFVLLMNKRASELSMDDTHYADAVGLSEDTVTTAADTAKLCAELLKHGGCAGLGECFVTWRDFVRGGKAELVNQNTLVKSLSGITGMKACVSPQGSCMTAVTATRGDTSLVCVAVDCADADSRASDAEKLLDYGFEEYVTVTLEADEELLEKIAVTHGVKESVGVKTEKPLCVTVRRGLLGSLTVEWERETALTAPVKAGDTAGEVKVFCGDEVCLETKLIAAEATGKQTVATALLMLLRSLVS